MVSLGDFLPYLLDDFCFSAALSPAGQRSLDRSLRFDFIAFDSSFDVVELR